MKQCDAKDGVADGMISDPLGCDFDPAVLACKSGQSDACIAPEKIAAIKKAFAGPKNAYGTQVYPGFLYDAGIAERARFRDLLALEPAASSGLTPRRRRSMSTRRRCMPPIRSSNRRPPICQHFLRMAASSSSFTATAIRGSRRSIRSTITSRLLQRTAEQRKWPNGAACSWCRGWLTAAAARLSTISTCSAQSSTGSRKGIAPESVIATGKAFPGRSRPLCPIPNMRNTRGSGDTKDAQ